MRPARAALVALLFLALAGAPARAETKRLVVVHTNDLHGHLFAGPDYLTPGEPRPVLGGIARVAAIVERERAAAAAAGAGFLYLDGGDIFHGSPEGDASKGIAIVEILNLLKPDAVCVGNHEFGYGVESFEKLVGAAAFPFVSANLSGPMAHLHKGGVLESIVKETGGLRVLVVGLTTEATPRMSLPEATAGCTFELPAPALRRHLDGVKWPIDITIALTHLGSDEDERLAEAVTACALIVGAHDHVVLEPAREVGDTLIVQAGEHMRRVGKVTLDYDTELRRVVRRRSVIMNVTQDLPESATVAAAVEARRLKALDEPCGAAAEAILRSYNGESEAGALACEAIREALRADLAIVNHTSVRGGFEEGRITRRNVYDCVPFQNPLVLLEMSGAELFEFLEQAVGRHGDPGLEAARVHVRFDPERPAGERIVRAEVGGAPIDRARTYRLATTEFFGTRTDAYPALRGKKRTDDARSAYDAFVEWLGRHSPVSAPSIGSFVPGGGRRRAARGGGGEDHGHSGTRLPGEGGGAEKEKEKGKEKEKPKTGGSGAGTGTGTSRVEIEILHTNDLHGQVRPLRAAWSRRDEFLRKQERVGSAPSPEGEAPPLVGGLSALASLIAAERANAVKERRGFLLLDAGDCWQGTPEGNLTGGRIVVEWMNLMGYDAMAIGNHEFDAGPGALAPLAGLARFPWLSANLVLAASGERPPFAHAAVEKQVAGLAVAIVGVTTEETKRISMPRLTEGFDFAPALEAAEREVAAARARGPDIVLVLSHCGLAKDRVIAASVPGIDAVIGGHMHVAIDPPIVDPETGTLIAATAASGTAIGEVRLVYDRVEKKVVSRAGRVREVETAAWPAHEATERLIAAYAPKIDAVMDAPLGRAEESLVRERGFDSSKLGSWLCDVMREAVRADVALTNKAGLRADVPAGVVRLREIYQVSPFGNTCVTMRLTGRELGEELEFALSRPQAALEASGLEVRYDLERPEGDRLIAVRVAGEPLSAEKKYLVVTNSFLAAGGDGHAVLAGGEDRADTGIDIMKLHADDVRRRGAVKLDLGARFAPAEPTIPAGRKQ